MLSWLKLWDGVVFGKKKVEKKKKEEKETKKKENKSSFEEVADEWMVRFGVAK